jgi:hypothetical protein
VIGTLAEYTNFEIASLSFNTNKSVSDEFSVEIPLISTKNQNDFSWRMIFVGEPLLDEAFSPPLSDLELREIHESEREFRTGKCRRIRNLDELDDFFKHLDEEE